LIVGLDVQGTFLETYRQVRGHHASFGDRQTSGRRVHRIFLSDELRTPQKSHVEEVEISNEHSVVLPITEAAEIPVYGWRVGWPLPFELTRGRAENVEGLDLITNCRAAGRRNLKNVGFVG
jgi:hypothetical protein